MKHVDEYRDAQLVTQLSADLRTIATRDWTLMEICGGQTHSIVKHGLDELLPASIELVHGPGCPVCVTPIELIDAAVAIAALPQVIFTSFGDMLRVPGSRGALLDARARGADVRVVYSALDAVKLAQANPTREVVFFAVGFETTAPGNALAVLQADALNVANFSMLVAHVLVPPAIDAIFSSDECRVQALLAPGHVCAIEGAAAYEGLCERWRVPIAITGFEPVDLLRGIVACVKQLEAGEARVDNQYRRAVQHDGNTTAREAVTRVFEVSDRAWRGLGTINASGLALREDYARFDALTRFNVARETGEEPRNCIAARVLQGLAKPRECAAFGRECTPDHPLGAPMVSSEGACAAYFHYGQRR